MPYLGATMEQTDLLSMLREANRDDPPSATDLVLKQLRLQTSLLDDLKNKLNVTNEVLLALLEKQRGRTCSDFGVQARPIRNKPFPSRPVRRSERQT